MAWPSPQIAYSLKVPSIPAHASWGVYHCSAAVRITDARLQAGNLRGPYHGKRRIASNREDDVDCFQAIPIIGTLTTSGWGIGTSGPRDPGNGIEDIANWRYWDGKIIQ
jgi:hypothetical protein